MKTQRVEILRQGLIAGMLGYAAVIAFFTVLNALTGRPLFHTAGVLGSALFYGAREAAEVRTDAGPVLAFNGVHLLLCVTFGILAAWLTELSELGEQYLYIAGVVLITFAFHLFGALLWLSDSLIGAIPAWSVVVSGLFCSGVIATYLLWIHPEARHAMIAPLRESY